MKVKVSPRKSVAAKPRQRSSPEVELFAAVPPRRSFIGKCMDIIREDWRMKKVEREALMRMTPEGWEDYKRFCELARGGRR
jgi:hypothetical protein